ncbi:MAG: hypothetical protein GWP91_19515, partial [Rhodobacterales bacterium]|nr:hypothetical protein [Rhodobacterales bacterium]
MRAVCTSLLVLISLTACNNDDKNTGVGTNSTTANNPPTVAAVVLNPDPGFEFTLLNCQATGLDDLNGDVVSLAYKWEVNGTEIAVVAGTLNGDDFSKGDTVSCTVTPNDGLIDGTPVASSIVTILNTPPAGTSVEIGPDPSNLLDTLTATPLGWTDPDGDAESWNFDWYVNGSSVGAATNTLSNSFEKGDEVYAIATPNDLDDLGEPLQSNTLVIVNTPPTLANATITPSAPFAGDILVCAPSGESDLDGDPVSYLFEWFVSGNAAGSGTEILVAPSFTRGDDVYCIITPTDLEDEGTPVQSGTVTIFNAAPTIAAATLTPEPAYKSTILACSGSGIVDTDGDAPLLSFSWTVGGVPIAAADPALDGASFSRDDAVQCTIIVSDGVDASAPAVSNLVVIQNPPPTATSVAIGPSSPYTGDPVSAIVSGWDDLDLDLEGYQYTWYVNGIERIGEVGVSLPAANYVKHDLITVQATPDDGTDTGPPVLSDPVEILNSSPVLDSADITPANPLATDTLTCNVGASSDDDGDGVSNSYQWFVNGVPVGSGTNQLAAPDFGAGDNIYCVATPNDGEEDGAPVQSATVSADNTAPTIQMVTLAPNPGYEDDVLTCTASGINDNDGDTVTLSYEWLVGGLPIAANTPTIDGANFNKDQAVQCIVTGNDGSTDSAPINSNVVFILNTPPSALSADISPTDPTTIDNVGVTMSGWLDINGDTESYLYQWSVNGFALPGQTGTSLTSANYVKGDLISITATPNDGTDFGTPIVSSEVPVLNTPPTLASATVTPASPVASDILGCTPSGGADIDGDTVTYTYQWYVNSIPAGTGPTLAAPASGDTAYCEVTPNDGDDDGTPVASGWVSVDNTAPTIGSVTLSPDPAYETTTLTCTAANVDDVDGDLVTLAYSWTVGGVPILPVTTTLNGAYFNREQAVQCFVIASDSSSNSGAVNSNLVVIQNTAPAFTSVVISPTDPTTTDNVTAAASGWSDLDGDGESYTYQWYVNSVLESGATNVSLTSGNYVKGDFLTVRATPFDGTDSGGSLLSAPIEVQNTAPTTPGISISPNPPDESENLICSIDTNSTDADNDAVIYLYSWNLGGAVTS